MKRFLTGLAAILFAFALVYLLAANRQLAQLSFDITNVDDPALALPPLPVAIHIVTGLLIGFVLGAIGMWSSGAPKRAELRARRREVRRLEAELREARQGLYQAEPTGSAVVTTTGASSDRATAVVMDA